MTEFFIPPPHFIKISGRNTRIVTQISKWKSGYYNEFISIFSAQHLAGGYFFLTTNITITTFKQMHTIASFNLHLLQFPLTLHTTANGCQLLCSFSLSSLGIKSKLFCFKTKSFLFIDKHVLRDTADTHSVEMFQLSQIILENGVFQLIQTHYVQFSHISIFLL